MTKQVYKSANGKTVDMGSLALQNEMVRAVGNMKVNARGDVIDEQNRVIAKKTDQVNKSYNQQIGKSQ
jgi:glycine cleavage system H lipoate-binding protein